jgi:lambda family phage portal protein
VGIFARYEGATFSPVRSHVPGSVQSARFDASASTRTELVRKSRYFERNNAIVNRLADLFECYTVGTGLQLSPASSDAQYNAAAKAWWDGWTRYCDLTSLQGFGTVQALIARTWFIDGEVFIKLTRGDSGRPRLQLIEGHRVRTPSELAHLEGTRIIDGVLIDQSGRPVGYYIADEDERGRLTFTGPTPADSVIHLFEPSRPGQYRGLPFLYPVINELHDLDDLHDLEMRAAKDAADITNVIKTKTGELAKPADLIRQRATQSTAISTGATVQESKSDYYQPRTGGRTVVLQKDDEMEQFRSERPGVVTRDYWRYKTELVCTGVGIPYVLVFPDSMQGTVYRGALDMANAFFRARSGVIADVCRRIYEFVMLWATANEPTLRDKPGDWGAVTIHPPRAVNVDVGRNSAAVLAELEVGATNYELIYAPLGLDWREQFRKLAEQKTFAKEIGLELGPKPQPPKPELAPVPDPEDATA